MSSEYTQNQTWTLVPPHSSLKFVGWKLVFKVKYQPTGQIDKPKARLLAKGYNQTEESDFQKYIPQWLNYLQ